MTSLVNIISFIGLLMTSSIVQASIRFEVVKKISGCKYFVAEQDLNYILAEKWTCSINRSSQGIGKLDGYGLKDVEIDGISCSVYIDDYLLSKSRAIEKLVDKCD